MFLVIQVICYFMASMDSILVVLNRNVVVLNRNVVVLNRNGVAVSK